MYKNSSRQWNVHVLIWDSPDKKLQNNIQKKKKNSVKVPVSIRVV